jgi:hypothetical protein
MSHKTIDTPDPTRAARRSHTRDAGETARRGRIGPAPDSLLPRQLGNARLQLLARDGSAAAPRVQRACACGGGCASCSEDRRLQPSLRVGPVGDAYEQEADAVADRVMRMPAPAMGGGAPAPPSIQRLSAGDGGGGPTSTDDLDLSGGAPLSESTRGFMEPRFGMDFGQVRLHADERAHAKSDELGARAFTYGNHIWLGRGESESDGRLLAHELTHVVQQGAAGERVQRTPQQDRCPGGEKVVTVDLISMPGSNRNPLEDLDHANLVYRPCCVRFELGTGLSVDPALANTWLGGDNDLAFGNACGSGSAEEFAMRAGADAAFGLSGRIRAFYVDTYTPATGRGTSYPPYCATGAGAPLLNNVYVTNTGARRTLAHEIGHILLNSPAHTGIDNPATADNIMVPTNTATGDAVDGTQCATIFASV